MKKKCTFALTNTGIIQNRYAKKILFNRGTDSHTLV